jgi:hypothetical protein
LLRDGEPGGVTNRIDGELPGRAGHAKRFASANLGNVGWQHDMSASHERIGYVLQAQGKQPEALESH